MRKIIFIAGFPRSGTTWFSNLLNAHPDIYYRHEIIGRNFSIFGEKIFLALKNNNGLSDEQYSALIEKISEAHVDTDVPPFFLKNHLPIKSPRFHHYWWLLSKMIPPLEPIYNYFFRVPIEKQTKILIKETRSSANLDSIMEGLRTEHILFLVRKPHGAIASNIKGIKAGTMNSITIDKKVAWLKTVQSNEYIKTLELDLEKLEVLSDIEFLALSWRVYHDDLLAYGKKFAQAKFISYESLVGNTELGVEKLCREIGLSFHENILSFIRESTTQNFTKKSILTKDSSNQYYSVYRSADFNTDAWLKSLTNKEIEIITHHTQSVYDSLTHE